MMEGAILLLAGSLFAFAIFSLLTFAAQNDLGIRASQKKQPASKYLCGSGSLPGAALRTCRDVFECLM
jgi:hypothetical protein